MDATHQPHMHMTGPPKVSPWFRPAACSDGGEFTPDHLSQGIPDIFSADIQFLGYWYRYTVRGLSGLWLQYSYSSNQYSTWDAQEDRHRAERDAHACHPAPSSIQDLQIID